MSGKSELRLFDRALPQVVVESASICDISPTTSISEDATHIDFLISGSNNEYLDLNDTLLYVRFRVVTADGKNLTVDAPVTTSNLLLNALFKDVKLSINQTVTEGGNQMYAYKSTIEDIFGFNSDAKLHQLEARGFDTSEDDRKKKIQASRQCELMGSLRLDFLNQPKYLLPGLDVKISLIRNSDSFALMKGNGHPKIQLLQTKLYVRRVKCNPSVLQGHSVGLMKRNAIYPFTRSNVVSYSIPKGSMSYNKDNLFLQSQLPKFVIVGMVKTQAYNGVLADDPFYFNHFDVSSVGLYKDGQSAPYREIYEPNFENDLFFRDYVKSIVHNTQHLNTNVNNGITMDEFKQGYTFFTFNLTPDFDMNQTQQASGGNLRLELRFSKPLVDPINVIVYATFDATLQITRDNQVICDHVH
jgi:hypothetical protein